MTLETFADRAFWFFSLCVLILSCVLLLLCAHFLFSDPQVYNPGMTLETVTDITPNGTATPIGIAGQKATWIGLVATGTTLRFGDASVGANRGMQLPAGQAVVLVRGSFNQQPYPLDKIYVYGTGTDKVSVTVGV